MAKSQKPKKVDTKLKLSDVKKASKKMDETDEYTVKSGMYKDKVVSYYPYFSEITIEELLLEYVKILEEAEEITVELSQQMQTELFELLIVKHFTHFKKEMPDFLLGEDKEVGLLDWLKHFKKTGIFTECLDEMFSPVEIHKVFDRFTDKVSVGLLARDINEEVVKKLQNLKLKNADIFKELAKLGDDNSENNVVK